MLFGVQEAEAQYTIFGNAVNTGGQCHQLTAALNNQVGAVYANQTIDLTQPFDFRFTVFLGTNNGGADGIVFVLRSGISPGFGVTGGSLGIGGLASMLGVEFDTWRNNNFGDPIFDHIAVISGGSTSHLLPSSLAGPIQASPLTPNIEDGQNHQARITWDPLTTTLSIYFDCTLRLTYTGDIVTNLFGGNPVVFWGFTGSTGGANNQQSFCQVPYPVAFSNSFSDTTVCPGSTVQLDVGNNSLASYSWSNTNTLSSGTIYNPIATPSTTTNYIATVDYACTSIFDTVTVNVRNTPKPDLGNDTTLCTGDTLLLDPSHSSYQSYSWSGGSADSTLLVNATSIVMLTVTDTSGCTLSDTIDIGVFDVPNPNLGADTTICPGDTVLLTATFQSSSYLWDDASIADTRMADQTGTYWVVVDNQGCIGSDTMNLIVYQTPKPDLGNDTIFCTGNNLLLDATHASYQSYAWSNSSSGATLLVNTTSNVTLSVTDTNGCQQSDTIDIGVFDVPNPNLGADTSICPGDTLLLTATFQSATYLWDNASVDSTRVVNQTGTYWVVADNQGCIGTDTMNLTIHPTSSVNLGPDTVLCDNATLNLSANVFNGTYIWQNGMPGNTFTVSLPGNYSVNATNVCGTFSDTIFVDYRFTPNVSFVRRDTICTGAVATVDATSPGATYLWSNGWTNPILQTQLAGNYWVQVTNQCGMDQDSFSLEIESPFLVDLGPDLAGCEGDTFFLKSTPALPPSATWQWSHPGSGTQLGARLSGDYWLHATNTCGTFRDTVNVYLRPPPQVFITGDTLVCTGQNIFLDAIGQEVDRYTWNTGENTASITVDESNMYSVFASSNCGIARDSLLVTVQTLPVVDLGPDTVFCRDLGTIELTLPDPALNYSWSTGSSGPSLSVVLPGYYSVTATDLYGCTNTDDVSIDEECPVAIWLPKAFSPNDDGNNDFYGAKGDGVVEYRLQVFDRWGEFIWETTNLTDSWDGTYKGEKAPVGVYIYTLFYRGRLTPPKESTGHLTLVR